MIEFFSYIQNSLIYKNFFLVLSGLDNTILLLLISLPLGFVLALLFALGRVSKITLLSRTIASYIFVIRGTPLLVQIYLIYFGLGSVKFIRESFLWYALKEPFWCGVIALTINTVAYGAEIFRGGIQSIEKSQVESGLSLGFGKFLLLRKIIICSILFSIDEFSVFRIKSGFFGTSNFSLTPQKFSSFPFLASLYIPLTSRFSQISIDASTKTSKN